MGPLFSQEVGTKVIMVWISLRVHKMIVTIGSAQKFYCLHLRNFRSLHATLGQVDVSRTRQPTGEVSFLTKVTAL